MPGPEDSATTFLTAAEDDAPAAPEGALALPARYVDRGALGAGGMGEVRRVYDTHLERVVALKWIRLEAAHHPSVHRRFLEEIRVTARLQHPGIVPIYDWGTLDDGRAWFTMKEVRGRTLGDVVRAVHTASPKDAWGTTDDGWGLRRLVTALAAAAHAVGYAHASGVLHRDLKPDNLMVGAFGEVQVMDWGVARIGAAVDDDDDGVGPVREGTRLGAVIGTPRYMAPEQASGDVDAHGPQTDVFALGVVLYEVLVGKPPPAGWLWNLAGLRSPTDATARPVPDELEELVLAAVAHDPEARPADGAVFAKRLEAWLDGARRREAALATVAEARALWPRVRELRAQAAAAEGRAGALLADVPSHAPIADKLPGWRLEEAAQAERREADRVEAELEELARQALRRVDDLPEAHALLADLYRERLETAEGSGDAGLRRRIPELERALGRHDRAGRHAAWLTGDGAVTLVTDPPGATVHAARYVEVDRRLVEEPFGVLGTTPLVEHPLPRGSWMLTIRSPGRMDVRYPVSVGRLEHWHGVRPGSSDPYPIVLPERAPEGAVYVPAGWYRAGGDPEALDSLSARRLWVDALWVMRHPVTCAEYARFLDAMGDEADGMEPDERFGSFVLGKDGWVVGAMIDGRVAGLEEPVCGISWTQAQAFAAWWSARCGPRWRLPGSAEWEKFARGVDGRRLPWGDAMDPSRCNMSRSHEGDPRVAPVGFFEMDIGPFGVRDCAGNTRDWCLDPYERAGIPDETVARPQPGTPDSEWILVRGGSFDANTTTCLVSARLAWKPRAGLAGLGFRLVRDA